MERTSGGDALAPYDAVLVHAFGGPEAPEEVLPFLRRVTGGRGIPEERLTEVAGHYLDRGGRSPINAETRDLAVSYTHLAPDASDVSMPSDNSMSSDESMVSTSKVSAAASASLSRSSPSSHGRWGSS